MTHTSALKDLAGGLVGYTGPHPTHVFNAVTDFALITLNEIGNIISWNSGAERIYGWRSEEILNRHFSLLYSSDAQLRGKPSRDLNAAAASGHCA
ncbi:MAG: kinB3, partial [Microvirga sp.]|nr:kinB3 [Microvirga sp.]